MANYKQHGQQGPRRDDRPRPGAPPRQKIVFYRDPEKKFLDPELFSAKAEELAKSIGERGKEKEGTNKRTQLRKFYDELARLNTLARDNPDNWPNIEPYVNMVIAKAVYAEGRKLVTEEFVHFIRDSVAQVKTAQDLDVFTTLFEAFMGFYKKYGAE